MAETAPSKDVSKIDPEDSVSAQRQGVIAHLKVGLRRWVWGPSTSKVNEQTLPEAAPDLYDELDSEQQKKALTITKALAEKFDRPMEDFSVISTIEHMSDDSDYTYKSYAVALTSDKGLPMSELDVEHYWGRKDLPRSYVSISDRSWSRQSTYEFPRDEFTVEVDGQDVDTLKGATQSRLEAVAQRNPLIDEWVVRTGEPEEVSVKRSRMSYGIIGQSKFYQTLMVPYTHLSQGQAETSSGSAYDSVVRPIVEIQ